MIWSWTKLYSRKRDLGEDDQIIGKLQMPCNKNEDEGFFFQLSEKKPEIVSKYHESRIRANNTF